jgi:ABC-type sugar transport system ATPase subunit
MKVLSAVYPHGTWEGEIFWEGKELKAETIRQTEEAGIVIIHQELMLVPQLSVAENIFMGNEIKLPGGLMNYSAMYKRAEELMAELKMPDVNVALPVYNYGGGHQQLIEIAKAINKKAKLLILDEPTSSLTKSETADSAGHHPRPEAQGRGLRDDLAQTRRSRRRLRHRQRHPRRHARRHPPDERDSTPTRSSP